MSEVQRFDKYQMIAPLGTVPDEVVDAAAYDALAAELAECRREREGLQRRNAGLTSTCERLDAAYKTWVAGCEAAESALATERTARQAAEADYAQANAGLDRALRRAEAAESREAGLLKRLDALRRHARPAISGYWIRDDDLRAIIGTPALDATDAGVGE